MCQKLSATNNKRIQKNTPLSNDEARQAFGRSLSVTNDNLILAIKIKKLKLSIQLEELTLENVEEILK